MALRHGPERVVLLVVLVVRGVPPGPRRELERAQRVVEGLLGAPRPPLHRRVAARRRRRVQVERNLRADAPTFGSRVGSRVVRNGLEDEPLFFFDRHWRLVAFPRLPSASRVLRVARATPRRANLRVQKTLHPPPRQHLGVAVPDLRPAQRVRVYVRRAHELGPRAERDHAEPRGDAPRVASHHRREHRLSPLGRARRVAVGEMREHRIVRAHRRRRDVVGERARRRAASGMLSVAPARVRGPVGRHARRTPRGRSVDTDVPRRSFCCVAFAPSQTRTSHDAFALTNRLHCEARTTPTPP